MCKHNKFEVGQVDNKEKLIKPLQLLTKNQSPLEATRNQVILLKNMRLEPKQQFKNNMKKYRLISQENPKLKNKKILKDQKLKIKEIQELKWKSLRIRKISLRKESSSNKLHHRALKTGSSFKYVLTVKPKWKLRKPRMKLRLRELEFKLRLKPNRIRNLLKFIFKYTRMSKSTHSVNTIQETNMFNIT